MKYKTTGDNLQVVTLELSSGERVYGEAGAMVYMSPNMTMEAKMRGDFLWWRRLHSGAACRYRHRVCSCLWRFH